MEDTRSSYQQSEDGAGPSMEIRRRTMDRRVGREAAVTESLLQPGDATSYRQPHMYTEEERNRMAAYESVDAFEPHNSVYLDHLQFRYSEPRWFVWVFTLVVGLLSGLCGVVFVAIMHVLISMKYYLLDFGLKGFPSHSSEERQHIAGDIFKGLQLPMQGNASHNFLLGYVMWASFSVVCALIAAILLKIVPEANGVGSSDVLAYLNGVDHRQFNNKRVFIARIVISLLTIGSGACTGYFGTLIQCGVMISTFVTERSKLIQFPNINVVRCFRNPKDRRNLSIIGAAAGVGSAFSVTIGGLMYVVEQIAQVIPVRVRLYTFCSCLISSFTVQVYFSYMNSFGERDRSGVASGGLLRDALIIFDTKLVRSSIVGMNIFDIFPTILIGVVCGGLSVLYVRLSWISLRLRRRLQKQLFPSFKYLQPVFITFLYVTITYWIAVGWGSTVAPTDTAAAGCSYVPQAFESKRKISVVGFYGTVSSLCNMGPIYNGSSSLPTIVNGTYGYSPLYSMMGGEHGSANESSPHGGGLDPLKPGPGADGRYPVIHNFASLALSPADSALQFLLSWSTADYLQLPTLIVFFAVYFFFTAFTAGVALAGDVILPALVIGGTVGRICGQITRIAAEAISFETLTWADPALFALVGAGSFLGGVTGMTFSVCIILMEMTGDNRHIICIMIGISISKMIADRFCHPITVSHLEAKCVPILDFAARIHKYDMFCARNIMQTPVLTFSSVMTAQSIADALGTTHNGFPVVSVRDKTFKGMVLRWQLEVILWNLYWTRKGDPCTYARIREIEDRRFGENLTGLPPLSRRLLRTHIDLLAYVDQSAYTVHEATSLSRTYHMFRTLGLRHLVVINRANQVVGMITRKDLVSDKMMERIAIENEKRRALLGYDTCSNVGDAAPSSLRPGSVMESETGDLTHDALSAFLLKQQKAQKAAGVEPDRDLYDDGSEQRKQQQQQKGLFGGLLGRRGASQGSRRMPKLSELVIDAYEDQEYTIVDIRGGQTAGGEPTSGDAPSNNENYSQCPHTPPRSPTAVSRVTGASAATSARFGGVGGRQTSLGVGKHGGSMQTAATCVDFSRRPEGYLQKNLVVNADEDDLEHLQAFASMAAGGDLDPRSSRAETVAGLVSSPVGVAPPFASPTGITGLGYRREREEGVESLNTSLQYDRSSAAASSSRRSNRARDDMVDPLALAAYGGYTAPSFTPNRPHSAVIPPASTSSSASTSGSPSVSRQPPKRHSSMPSSPVAQGKAKDGGEEERVQTAELPLNPSSSSAEAQEEKRRTEVHFEGVDVVVEEGDDDTSDDEEGGGAEGSTSTKVE